MLSRSQRLIRTDQTKQPLCEICISHCSDDGDYLLSLLQLLLFRRVLRKEKFIQSAIAVNTVAFKTIKGELEKTSQKMENAEEIQGCNL